MKKNYVLGLSEDGFHKMSYTEWPCQSEKNPVICVHGVTRNNSDFIDLATHLTQQGHPVYCPDIVGRGDSDWLANPLHYTYEQYLADLNALIARTGKTTIDWIGTSMGGLLGMILAAMPKTPIQRLVLNDIGPQIPVKAIARLTKYTGQDPNFNSLEEAKAYFKTNYADFGHLTETQWQRFTENSVREIAPGKFTTKIDHGIKIAPAKSKLAWQLFLHPHKALEGTFFDVDLWSIWRNVRVPVLVIHGQHSDVLLPKIIEKMHTSHHDLQVIEVPEAGHAPALFDMTLLEKIARWLKETA